MITDAISKETELIFRGKNGRKVIGSAFGVELSENHIHLKNIVSRKKQLIPAIMTVITE